MKNGTTFVTDSKSTATVVIALFLEKFPDASAYPFYGSLWSYKIFLVSGEDPKYLRKNFSELSADPTNSTKIGIDPAGHTDARQVHSTMCQHCSPVENIAGEWF